MIYTDGAHLVGDSEVELHAFAHELGLKRAWYKDESNHPYYVITSDRLRFMVSQSGAVQVDPQTVMAVSQAMDRN